jgi:hypothetical protein
MCASSIWKPDRNEFLAHCIYVAVHHATPRINLATKAELEATRTCKHLTLNTHLYQHGILGNKIHRLSIGMNAQNLASQGRTRKLLSHPRRPSTFVFTQHSVIRAFWIHVLSERRCVLLNVPSVLWVNSEAIILKKVWIIWCTGDSKQHNLQRQ